MLEQALQQILPGARLELTTLPGLPLRLQLLAPDYPQGALNQEQVRAVMDNPLYWIFCWASGQVLAQHLLQHPQWVRGRRVLDFGCGSGVVAIAAALAGAREVVACDNDPLALASARRNAALNGVELVYSDDYFSIEGHLDLVLVADVLYDRANFPWLQRFLQRAEQVLVADSRVKDFDLPRYRQVGRYRSCTWPDLDESAEFRDVRLYLGAADGPRQGADTDDS
jgi:predicted nicotinamide N-methyase